MANKMRRTKITIETHEVKVIRRRGQRISVFCKRCQTLVEALTPDEVFALYRIPVSELAGSAEIHFIETTKGNPPLICVAVNQLNNRLEIINDGNI